MLLPDDLFVLREHRNGHGWRVKMNKHEEEGYSGLFYAMLILGIIGLLGFFVIATSAGAASGL